jgi:hypothetical protein
MKATIKFKPCQSYETRLISDYDSRIIFKIYRRTEKSLIQLCDLTEADAVRVSDFHTTELPCCS